MKTFLAFVLGGLLVWAVMTHYKPAPVVQVTAEPERATLHEQVECAAATERYAKQNEFDPNDDPSEHGSATLHSHYDATKRQCVGVRDWEGPHLYGANSWYSESIDVFDPVEGRNLAGGYWKSAVTDANHVNMNSIYTAKSWPRGLTAEENDRIFKQGNQAGITVGEFFSSMSDQYGTSE
jgi:hypothetical protein